MVGPIVHHERVLLAVERELSLGDAIGDPPGRAAKELVLVGLLIRPTLSRRYGTGSSASNRSSRPSGVMLSASASNVTSSRCRSTSRAIDLTSCGTTYSRPSSSARALADRTSAIVARGLAP